MTTLADGQIVACSRCGRPCRVAATRSEDARLLRNALTVANGGWCANCGMTAFIRFGTGNVGPGGDGLGLMFRDETDPGVLRLRSVQEAIERVLAVGKADARPEDLDWETMFANWNLPFPEFEKGKQR